MQIHAVQHLAGTPSLSDGTGAQLFLRVAFDILMVHGTQLACLRRPPTQIVALDNFLQLIGQLIAHESIEKATHFAKSMIYAAVEACRDACRRRKGALLTRPLHRIFIGIVNELLAMDRVPLYIGLDALAHGLRHLEPRAYPAFSFSWLEILAHRKVMVPMVSVRPPLLASHTIARSWFCNPDVVMFWRPADAGAQIARRLAHGMTGACVVQGPLKHQMQDIFVQLLCMAFHMLSMMLRESRTAEASSSFYNGIFRMLIVLMHDFPDILCANHVKLCLHMPPRCVQLRNIVLSAFPKSMRLIDPNIAASKFDKIPELAEDPAVSPPPWDSLTERQLLSDIDAYLKAPSSEGARAFVLSLPKRLATASASGGGVGPITAVMLCVGLSHISSGCRGTPVPKKSPAFHLFLYLAKELPAESQRIMYDAMANQLRYPSSHTYYFSSLMLSLFLEVGKEGSAREIITRVLLERVVALKPHPWGTMVTFCELLRNSQYAFWSHDFIKCTPEINALFDTLYRAESVSATLTQSLALPGVARAHG